MGLIRITRILVDPFYIIVSTLLTLLLPLSFLLLSRLATENYLFTLGGLDHDHDHDHPLFYNSSLIFSEVVFLTIRPVINHLILIIVSILSIASLSHGLAHKLSPIRSTHDHDHDHDPPILTDNSCFNNVARLRISWILLCLVQLCVGIGTEGSLDSGVEYGGSKGTTGFMSRVLFFLGLHESMLYWWRMVVKPVVDETVYGEQKIEERWVERAVVAASFGGLWWWRLRDEVEALVGVVEAKKMLLFLEIGVMDFVGWWLYYLTVTIGIVKIVKSSLWVGMILLFERRSVELGNPDHIDGLVVHYYNYRDNDHELKV